MIYRAATASPGVDILADPRLMTSHGIFARQRRSILPAWAGGGAKPFEVHADDSASQAAIEMIAGRLGNARCGLLWGPVGAITPSVRGAAKIVPL